MFNRPLPAPARDIALLIGRVVLGIVLFAHGWQKLVINGIAGTYGQFEKMGIPLAIVSASFTSFVEFVGGALLVVGALTTTVVALDLVVMVGAAGFVHITHGIFAADGGWELVGVIVAAELALAATGPGRFSLDHMIASRRSREDAAIERSQTPVHRAVAPETGTFAAAVRHAPGRAPQHVSSSQPMARYVGAGQAVGRARVLEQPRTAQQAWTEGARIAPAAVAGSSRTGEQSRGVDQQVSDQHDGDQSPTTALPVVPAQGASAPPVGPGSPQQSRPSDEPRSVEQHWMAEESRIAEQAPAYEPATGFQPVAMYDPAPMFEPAQRIDSARPFDPARPAAGAPGPDRRQQVGTGRAELPRQAEATRVAVVEDAPTAEAAPGLAADVAAALASGQPRPAPHQAQPEPQRPSSDLPQRAARAERVRMAATPFQ